MISEQQVMQALNRVVDERTGAPLIEPSSISTIVIREGKVGFSLTLPGVEPAQAADIRQRAEIAVKRLPGVEKVTVVLTAEAGQEDVSAPAAPRRPEPVWQSTPIPGVARVMAVASGKGGVGKSTTAVNLAAALSAQGMKVGLLDADIYGPSLPRMLGISGQPEVKDGLLQPAYAHGMACMSMGLVAGDDKPVVWRGAMVTKALHQMLRGVNWQAQGPLDVLLIDMPPGTGDAHLSLAQAVPLDGVVIVSTPQEVALLDATKCLQMFRKVMVPVLGMVENMSYFDDPASGHRSYIFGEGGARRAAHDYHIPFLGEVPIDMAVREQGDVGQPLPLTMPDSAASEAYRHIAAALMQVMEEKSYQAQQEK